MKLHFISANQGKIDEVRAILQPFDIHIESLDPKRAKIEELQTEDLKALVHNKALKAFSVLGRPLLVEHTALYLAALGELPGGLTQIFFDRLQVAGLINLLANVTNKRAKAKTVVGYCDGRKIWLFSGEIHGNIAAQVMGTAGFGWDGVFIPDGATQTLAELGVKKNEYSMRRIAFEDFVKHYKGSR